MKRGDTHPLYLDQQPHFKLIYEFQNQCFRKIIVCTKELSLEVKKKEEKKKISIRK